MTKLLYFAWLRERVGCAEEEVDLPSGVRDVAGLLDWLATRGSGFQNALEKRAAVRVAVNQVYATPTTPVGPGDEIALFPPVTGGAA